MNIKKENVDELNAVLSINLEKSDYESRVGEVLKDYKKKARIDGFRPGKVPFGIINKMYRTPVLVEEVNKLVSESISKYLVEEKLNILGEPIPHEGETKKIDWENDSDFEFKFDLGLAPEFEMKITAKDKIPYYTIKVDKAIIDKYVDSYTQQFGENISVDKVEEKDILKADIVQLDEQDKPVEGGISVEDASLSIEVVKDKDIKKTILAAKKGDVLAIDLKKAYPSDVELAALLKVEKEALAGIENKFNVSIKDISRFVNATVNQELFDKAFGDGEVKTEKEFRDKIAEQAKTNLVQDSNYRLQVDIKESLLKKFKSKLPNEFLKRWLLLINQGKFTMEQIEKEFESFEDDLKWQLVKDRVMKDNDLKISDEDMQQGAINLARMQFAQYGMGNVPDEHLIEFAKRMLEKEEDRNNIQRQVIESKVVETVKSIVKLEEKEISSEKFNKLFEK